MRQYEIGSIQELRNVGAQLHMKNKKMKTGNEK